MTRKEFEDWLNDNNFRIVYDSSYKSYDYCKGIQDPFRNGTFGCYEANSKWYVQSYEGPIGDRPSTNYSLSYIGSIDTEEEALEILKTRILEYEHETICANYEKSINAFIEEIKGKKIQNYFTYENNNCDITRKDLDVLIGKYFKDCSYGFPKGTEQSLYIIHNNTHRPILCIKGYKSPFPKIDYTSYIPIIYEYMNKKIMFLGNVIYELNSAHYDFQVDSTGIYLLESNSIKKFDFNGKILWKKEMKFNSPNVRFATNRELLIKEYNLEEYIGIIDLENLHIVSKGNDLLVKYKDIVCKIEENDDTIYLIPKMIYEQFEKVFGDDANIHVSPEDERINNQEEELVKLLKQKMLDYGFEEIDGEYKLQVYKGKNFNRVKVDEKNYGVSYGFFELKKNNEIIYARELWTGMSDIPVYIQLTKKEYDTYIDKLNGKEIVELPTIDESERCFCDSYRNSGRNHFSYNDVFHESFKDKTTVDINKIVNVECFACNTKFQINCSNIPSNQKTFYWNCSNCNAELKIGNPNYSDNSENREDKNLTDRDKLIKSMQLPSNIRSLSKEEQNEVIIKTIIKINEILKNIQCDNSEYELSNRQKATKNNTLNNIKAGEFLEAYYEITDLVDNYGDNHNGKVFETEKQEIYNLIMIIYNEIKG